MTQIKVHNIETNEIVEREMNEDELARWQKDNEIAEAERIAKAKAKSAKIALLEKLGITEEEAKLLLA
jgi:hypothetical protein